MKIIISDSLDYTLVVNIQENVMGVHNDNTYYYNNQDAYKVKKELFDAVVAAISTLNGVSDRSLFCNIVNMLADVLGYTKADTIKYLIKILTVEFSSEERKKIISALLLDS